MNLRENILFLLEHYNQMRAEIDTLQYELEHLGQLRDSEMIEAMTFSVPTSERVSTGGTSDKTTGIALNYQERMTQLQKDAVNEITGRLAHLTTTVERLDFYIGKLPALAGKRLRKKRRNGRKIRICRIFGRFWSRCFQSEGWITEECGF